MVTITAKLAAKKGKESDLKGILTTLIAPTRKEKGCILYVLHESAQKPGTFMFYEQWQSQDHLDAHMKTAHFLSAAEAMVDLLEGEMELGFWEIS